MIGYICALSDHFHYDALARIASLRDSKGILRVQWRDKPSEADKRLVTAAWQSDIGDYSDNVEHVVLGDDSGF